MANEGTPLNSAMAKRVPRGVLGAAALAAVSGLLLLAVAWNSTAQGPQEKLMVVDIPMSNGESLGQMQVTPQQLNAMALQRLWLYGNTDETDMWIRVAEGIDHDAVNDPALPPVPDEIISEAQQASNEAKLEHEYLEKYYQGNPNDSTAWRLVPVQLVQA